MEKQDTVKQPQVEQQVEVNRKIISDLIENLTNLEERLFSILRPEGTSPTPEDEEPEALVPLAGNIMVDRKRIESQIFRIKDILRRLEL